MTQQPDVHTLGDFTQHSSELIQKLIASGRPKVLTVEGKPAVVVLGVEAYQRLAQLAERWDTIAQVREGLEDVEAGRHKGLSDVIHDLRARYGSENEG